MPVLISTLLSAKLDFVPTYWGLAVIETANPVGRTQLAETTVETQVKRGSLLVHRYANVVLPSDGASSSRSFDRPEHPHAPRNAQRAYRRTLGSQEPENTRLAGVHDFAV